MNRILALLAVPALAACAATQENPATPINQLALPAASTIQGEVASVKDKNTFTLKDASGSVVVEWEGKAIKPALKKGEALTVAGVVDEDESVNSKKPKIVEFDAYCLKRANGELLSIIAACPLNEVK